MEDIETKFQVWNSPACGQRKANRTNSMGKKDSKGKPKDVGAGNKHRGRTARSEANDNTLEEDDSSFIGQLDEGSGRESFSKRRTRSCSRVLNGTWLPIQEDTNGESDSEESDSFYPGSDMTDLSDTGEM
jgi:hypothetical protein